MVRPSWAEIDLEAIATNVRTFSDLVAPARFCAVVKADAYGHGDVPVAETAMEAGADRLAVALVEEGVRLREAGIDAPILLLSEPPLDAAGEIIRWGLTPTVYRRAFAEALAEHAHRPLKVHVKVDTGMHRVGAPVVDAIDLVRWVADRPELVFEGLWTHFASAEDDEAFTRLQLERYRDTTDRIEAAGFEIPLRHTANTAAAILYPEARMDMVRIGIGMYGIRPASDVAPPRPLHPAMRIVSQVAMVRRYPAGVRPSYGRRRALPSEATAATVPIGYADGMPRALSDGGDVLIHGRRCPLAGTVTMDQIVVDVGDDDVAVGDEVVLIGTQGAEEITADEWAEKVGTIPYEIVCQIGPRLPRRYLS